MYVEVVLKSMQVLARAAEPSHVNGEWRTPGQYDATGEPSVSSGKHLGPRSHSISDIGAVIMVRRSAQRPSDERSGRSCCRHGGPVAGAVDSGFG